MSATVPTVSDDYTIVRSPVTNGLPHIIHLAEGLRLKVTLPTGLMQTWLEADPSALVSSADDELRPRPKEFTETVGDASRTALRLTLVQGGAVLATIPATLATRRSVPDAGNDAQGVAFDIVLLDWSIHAGTQRGPGDFGSYIHLGWKAADRAASDFSPPALNEFVRRRLSPALSSGIGPR